MKINFIDGNIIVFLSKHIKLDLDDNLEDDLKNIFNKLNKYYNLKIAGYYDIYIYVDKNYGKFIKLYKIDDYMSDNFVDMKIYIKDINLLYKIEDDITLDTKYKIYLYKGNVYLELDDKISDDIYASILENSELIYDDIDIIKKYGKIV